MNRTQQLAYLRSKPVLISLAVAAAVILIWLVAFYLPQSSKASKLSSEVQSLQHQVAQGNAKLAMLKRTSQATPELEALLAKYQGYVPDQADVLSGPSPYVDLLVSTANATGVKLVSITPGSVTAVPGLAFSGIPVTVALTGAYDSLFAFVKALYDLPRLTSIQSISVSGGGPGTNRSTPLTTSLTLQIYTTAKPAST